MCDAYQDDYSILCDLAATRPRTDDDRRAAACGRDDDDAQLAELDAEIAARQAADVAYQLAAGA